MKVTQKQIEDMIVTIAGKDALPVYKALKDKQNMNEFLLTEKVKMSINQVRNILYAFDNHNLLSSTRKKDRKKGWYIYFWTFSNEQAAKVVVQLKKVEMKRLQQQLDREKQHQYYVCPNHCTRATIENAMENQFLCSECGSLMVPEDNVKSIKKIGKQIDEIHSEVVKLEA